MIRQNVIENATHYCEGGFHDEPRFSFLNFDRLVESFQNFEYEYNYKKRS